ncbi:hypothetical protein C3F09_03195 [candidate division GN15 bacterium]|uniref:Tetratricopeptide repeat protein n=1 Tax=candidate division GN15 bacterium TaxID=2072418 RepID=A0A855XB80_9BACT|nr:MAG: hypothetical protein C3F09_03195 [candidate division GN15 bacterium]
MWEPCDLYEHEKEKRECLQKAMSWCDVGHVYLRLDQKDLAQKAFEEARSTWPNLFEACTGLGQLHAERREYAAAVNLCVAGCTPAIGPAVVCAVVVLRLLGRCQLITALELAEYGTRKLGYSVYLVGTMATVLEKLGETKKARKIMQKLRKKHRKDVDELGFIGDQYMGMNETAPAQEVFAEVIGLSPQNMEYRVKLAELLESSSDAKTAIDAWLEVIKLDGNHELAHRSVGCLLYNSGRYHEAILHFKQAVSLIPDSACNRFLLANCYKMLGHKDLFREQLQMAAGLDKNYEQFLNAEDEDVAW